MEAFFDSNRSLNASFSYNQKSIVDETKRKSELACLLQFQKHGLWNMEHETWKMEHETWIVAIQLMCLSKASSKLTFSEKSIFVKIPFQ